MSKKGLTFLFLFVVLFTLCSSATSFAKEKQIGSLTYRTNSFGPEVTGFPERWVVEPGDTFTVKFALHNVSDLYGASLDLKFDQTMLQVVNAEDVQTGEALSGIGNVTIPLIARDYNDDGIKNVDDVNEAGVINYAWHLLGETSGIELNDGEWHALVQVTFKVSDNVDFKGNEFIPMDFFFSSHSPDSLEDDSNNGMAVVKLANSQEPDGEVTNEIGYEGYMTTVFVYPSLEEGQYRAVLDWNAFPSHYRDLDAHMTVPQDGFKTEVSWSNEGQLDEFPYAKWIGDIEYPVEVITLSQVLDGTYEFMVHDYDRDNFEGVTPKVTVYDQNGEIAVYDYSQAQNQGSGSWWNVFTMESENLSEVNVVNKGLPMIEYVHPELLPGTPSFNLHIEAWNIDSLNDLEVEIFTCGENPVLVASSTYADIVEQWEEGAVIFAEIDAGNGLTPGEYQLVLKADGEYSIAYPVAVTENPVLLEKMFPHLQKVGVTSFRVGIPGFNLVGNQFSAVLKDENGNVVAQSSVVNVLEKEPMELLEIFMDVIPGQSGIPEGRYCLELESGDLEVLNEWGDPYCGEIEFVGYPVFLGMEPDRFKTHNVQYEPVRVYGWNIADQDWFVKIYNEDGIMVHEYQAMTAIEDNEGFEALPVFNLPSLSEGEYWMKISSADGNASWEWDFIVKSPDANDLIINTDVLPGAIVGEDYTFNLNAGGGIPPYTWSLAEGSSLPIGLSLSEEGFISGAPLEEGEFSFTIQVQDEANQISFKKLKIEVYPQGTNVIIPRLILEKDALGRGEQFALAVQLTNLQNGDKTNSVSFEIEYDSSVFELATGEPESDIKDGYINFTTKDDLPVSGDMRKVTVMLTSITDTLLQEGETVFSVNFKVRQDAPLGEKAFVLNCGEMLDSSFNVYNINFDQPETIFAEIINGGVIEGYLSIYLGDTGSGLNNLVLNKLSQTAINETFGGLQFTLKNDNQDPGTVINGFDVFLPDEEGNVAAKDLNNRVTGKFRINVSDMDNTILKIGGSGYLRKEINISLTPGQVLNIGSEEQPIEIFPGDLGQVNQGLKFDPDGKVDNVDFSAWLKTYKDGLAGNAEPVNLRNADMTKDGKVDNVDFSLWLNSYKKILTLPQ